MSNYIFLLKKSWGPISQSLRNSLYDIAQGIYSIVEVILNLFFKISDYTLFDNDLIGTIFSRLLLVIGVFMLFKLIINLISYLINPELIKDKERGAGKLITRMVMMLILLYLFLPQPDFSLWGDDSACNGDYNKCPNNKTKAIFLANSKYKANGILFGALYDFQYRIINEGTISKIILGDKLGAANLQNLNVGADIANNIHLAFLTPYEDSCPQDAKDEIDKLINSLQGSTVQSFNNQYQNLVTKTCPSTTDYMFEYNGFTALFVGIGVVILVFLFSFDIAIRMIKLGILRLLSPIPAISYIDPKSSKDGTFANYVKALTSTYLELFLRFAIIFLAIAIIENISESGQTMFKTVKNSSYDMFAKVIIYVSLLFFAGQAPKFIQQALGIKSKGTGLGFGAALLGGALSGAVSGFATGGLWGAAKGLAGGANAGAQNQWARQNGQNPGGSARQSARQRGAELGKGEYDPSKSGLGGLIGGRLATAMTHTTKDDIDKTKGAMYKHQDMLGKQKNLIDDFRNGVVDDTSRNLSANQINALKDANIDYDAATGTFKDHSTGNLMDKKAIVDRLQDRASNHETSAGKLESAVKDAEAYRQARIPRSKNPKIGILGERGGEYQNLRYRANSNGSGPRQPKGEIFGPGYDNDKNINY